MERETIRGKRALTFAFSGRRRPTSLFRLFFLQRPRPARGPAGITFPFAGERRKYREHRNKVGSERAKRFPHGQGNKIEAPGTTTPRIEFDSRPEFNSRRARPAGTNEIQRVCFNAPFFPPTAPPAVEPASLHSPRLSHRHLPRFAFHKPGKTRYSSLEKTRAETEPR